LVDPAQDGCALVILQQRERSNEILKRDKAGSDRGESGTKSEPVVIEGRDVVTIAQPAVAQAEGDTSAQPEGDTLNTAVCVGEGSQGNLHVQWKAGDAWKSTGNIGIGCVEILGASSVKVRAVEPYLDEAVSYYTCTKE
jgi:hypothetical protein